MAPIPGLLLGEVKAGNAGAVCGVVSGGASVSKVGIGDLQCVSPWLPFAARELVSRRGKQVGPKRVRPVNAVYFLTPVKAL
jgi:hypothetical protein